MRAVESVDALRGLAEAMRRGSKRSRLRLTAGVCPQNHTLLEVFRGGDGLLWVVYPWGNQYTDTTLMAEALGGEQDMGALLDSDGDMVLLPRCRCKDVWSVKHLEIQSAINQEHRRFVVSGVS